MRAGWILMGLMAACYAPAAPAGRRCSAAGACPDEQVCVATICVLGGSPATPDAAAPSPEDGDGDGVPDTRDNCPAIGNPNQPDEDHDGVGDACDLCPQIAETAPIDGDGDGIGDACDPNPLAPDAVWLFEGFHGAAIPSWERSGSWTAGNDALTVVAGGNAADAGEYFAPTLSSGTSALDRFSAAVTLAITQTPGGLGEHALGVSVYDLAAARGVYCDLFQGDSADARLLELSDERDNPATSPVRKTQALAWEIGVEHQVTLVRQGTTYTCTAVGGGTTKSVTLTSSFVPGHVEVGAFGAAGVVGSVFVVGPR